MAESINQHKSEMRNIALSHCNDMFTIDKLKILQALKDIHSDTEASLDTILEIVKRARVDTVDLILPEPKESK